MTLRSVSILFLCLSLPLCIVNAETVNVSSETASDRLLRQIEDQLDGQSQAETEFEARRQARRAAERIENYLNSQAYFAPDISYAVEPGERPVPRVKVEPGPRFVIGAITTDMGGAKLSAAASEAISNVLVLQVGDLAEPAGVIAQEAGLVTALRVSGYAEARAEERQTIGDRDAATLDIEYKIDVGPRIVLGEVVYPTNTRTRRDYLDRLIPFEPGTVYDPSVLSAFSRRFNATRLYGLTNVQIADTASETLPNGDEVRDVIVQLQERPRYTLTSGTSFSTSEGPGFTGSLTRRNATRRGDTITATATVATLERALGIDWRIPNFLAFDRTLVLSAEGGREETDAFDRESLTLSGTYEIRASRKRSFTLGLGSEFTREEDAFEQRDQQILSSTIGARFDYADDPLDATSGWRVDTRAEPGVVIGDREAQYLSLNTQLSAYQKLDEDANFVIASRLRSGFVFGAALEELPVSRRFFAGGGGSARGFEYQSVGPRAADGTPTGGKGLLEVSGEMRWRRDGPLGFVAFLDGASVVANESANFDDVRYSGGIGVRYDTLVGPIRFDLATPLDPRDGDDPVQVYVSIGQAF
ncbi:MAG: BamA/TamA family outer membrane protein [Pseudomonadota bacterium]